MPEPRAAETIAGPDGADAATAALAAVFAASPSSHAVFDDAGRCVAASPVFSRRAAGAADTAGHLSTGFLAAADVRTVSIAGRAYTLVTLRDEDGRPAEGPAAPIPARAPAAVASAAAPAADSLESVLRALLDAIPSSINLKDRSLRYLFMNRGQAQLWGLDPAAAIGRTAAELRGEHAARSLEHERRVLETGEAIPFFDDNLAGADGVVRDWLVAKLPIKNPRTGETEGVATFALDVSDRKRLEAALIATKRAAETASQAKTMFLAQVSHELRTPLNAIIGFTEMMTQEIFGPLGAPQYHGYAGDVLKAARHLLSIITDMLDVTRLDASALALDLAPVSPGEIVGEAGRMMAPAASSKRIQLRQFVEPALPALNADARRLRQALINLIANAVKFTREGGTVGFGARRVEGGIELYVEDNGIGMTPEDITVALTVFGRAKDGYAKAQEGTGIGLPLAKALIERHGGRFTIESARGKGTKIKAQFPAECLAKEGNAA
jgi:PAS domain S-box-containing protein